MKKLNLKPWSSIGFEEITAACRAIGVDIEHYYEHTDFPKPLSDFLGGELEGGLQVQALEKEWTSTFNVTHAVSVNSATSGLLIALKACGVGPGDEVIVSPYSMSAGVAAVLWCGAYPAFVDINDDTYSIDYDAAYFRINERTKAMLVTNLFGRVTPPRMFPNVAIIEDNAQAPFTGGHFGDVVIDSFNVHKPMQAGEGGVCWTRYDLLAERMKHLRNHGEIAGGPPSLNLRMVEVTAAIAREQLKKGRAIVEGRRALIQKLIEGTKDIPGLIRADYDPNHSYYIWATRVAAGKRASVVTRLNELGVPAKAGYVDPLYTLPAFAPYKRECPNCEKIAKEIITLEMYAHDYNDSNIEQVAEAYREAMQ